MKTTVSLNSKQIELITFISKYRFVNVAEVQKHFNLKSRPSVNLKLKVLVASGHIGMLYDPSYKLIGKPATFYLTPKGLREAQKKLPYITDAIIKSSYSDKAASDSLIQESSAIFELSKSLSSNYPNMKILTARQLGDIEYMPRPLPNLYLAHQTADGTARHFLYHLRDIKRYDVAVNSRIAKLMKYRESEAYAESGNTFPYILLVCDSAAIERLSQRTMRSALNRSYESIQAYTTSYHSLLHQTDESQAIWSSIEDPESLLSLSDIESET